jgi:hypothetical protein
LAFSKPAVAEPARATKLVAEPVDEVQAPVKRAAKKPEPVVAASKDVTAMLDDWGSDDE